MGVKKRPSSRSLIELAKSSAKKRDGRNIHHRDVPETIKLRAGIPAMAIVGRYRDPDEGGDRHKSGYDDNDQQDIRRSHIPVSYTHLTLPTNREV